MRIVIVGNGIHPGWRNRDGTAKNWSEHIDAADQVVRINAPHYYQLGFTGTKTTIMVVRSACSGYGKKIVSQDGVSICDAVISQVKKLVVIGFDDDPDADAAILPYLTRYPKLSPTSVGSYLLYPSCQLSLCKEIGITARPTAGAYTIDYIRGVFPEAFIELAGWYWNEKLFASHDLMAEKVWIDSLVSSKVAAYLE